MNTGANVANIIDQNNRQLHKSQLERIDELAGGDKEKKDRLFAAACALMKCSAELVPGSETYNDMLAFETLGASDEFAAERALLTMQTAYVSVYAGGMNQQAELPLFDYSSRDYVSDLTLRLDNTYAVTNRATGLVMTVGGEVQAIAGTGLCTTGVGCLYGVGLTASGLDTAYTGSNAIITGSLSTHTAGARLLESFGVPKEYSELVYGMVQLGGAARASRTASGLFDDRLSSSRITGIGESATNGTVAELTISANPATGNPAAIARGFGSLNTRQSIVLEQLNKYGSQTVTSKAFGNQDLAALSAATGDEFAMFTTGGRRLII
ncbi:hypothetical protein LPW36_10605 [Jinshanibacter sp. LJY008]|uniref:Uncharacterized protein n=1 Tax=Limnobaculum eriocheiris TaxID=2897391 RepID=A0A9X1SL83_9GAMM|nr:hypothetical protein [Limnobaculum eriocheiris]MCD1126440.1 hypothetical protein [Limnobaculum eriocheiris]